MVEQHAPTATPPHVAPPAASTFSAFSSAPGVTSVGEDTDDGQLEFDFADLDLTSGATVAGGRGVGDVALDFAAIDEDLQLFAQDDVVKDVLSRGVDLRTYAKGVDSELRAMEIRSISDYVAESDAIAGLFEQIVSCEGVLGSMQSLLQGFQDKLSGISNEIRSLQEQSLGMSAKMTNRKSLHATLRSFLDKVAVPEGLIDRLVDGPLEDGFWTDLTALNTKLDFAYGVGGSKGAAAPAVARALPTDSLPLESGAPVAGVDLALLKVSPFSTPAGREALPALDKLKVRVTLRVREHLARTIGELSRPKTSMQKIQEYVLLKAAPGMTFLNNHAPDAGREVRSLYADTVGRGVADVFKRYYDELAKALLPLCIKSDTVVEYTGRSVAAPGSAGGGGKPSDPFTIGDRLSLLDHADDPPLPAHVVSAEKTRLSFEALFRSVERHLMDVAAAEDSFDRRFFGPKYGPEVFQLVLSRAFNVLFAGLEEYLAAAGGDAPGLVLLVAIVGAHKASMGSRKLVCLDPFFDRVVLLVWPRFKAVFDGHVAAVKGARDASKLGHVDVGPHPITRRFAEMNASLLLLHRKLTELKASDEMLPHHLCVLLFPGAE